MKHAFVLSMMLAACGGGSGGGFGPGALTQAQAEEVCTTDCQHDIDCGSTEPLAACVTECATDDTGWARADAFQAVTNCIAQLACSADDDQCVVDNLIPLPIHEEWESVCLSGLSECLEPNDLEICEATPSGTSDAGLISLFAEPIVQEMIDCVAAPACQALLDCIEAVFTTHGINL